FRLKRDIFDQAMACAAVITPSGDTHRRPSAVASPTRNTSPFRRTATSRPARTVSGREAQRVWTAWPVCLGEELPCRWLPLPWAKWLDEDSTEVTATAAREVRM